MSYAGVYCDNTSLTTIKTPPVLGPQIQPLFGTSDHTTCQHQVQENAQLGHISSVTSLTRECRFKSLALDNYCILVRDRTDSLCGVENCFGKYQF